MWSRSSWYLNFFKRPSQIVTSKISYVILCRDGITWAAVTVAPGDKNDFQDSEYQISRGYFKKASSKNIHNSS